MYNNRTDSELLNVLPTTELEAELIKRLAGSTEQDWEALKERVDDLHKKSCDSEEFAEKLREALRKVATEIHRCASFGNVEVTDLFRKKCNEVIESIGAFVTYEIPHQPHPCTCYQCVGKYKNNSSSFRAGGAA